MAAAIEHIRHAVRYVPDYVRIPYPNGDFPTDTEVCTDVIIRSYRLVGVDLQKEVHEDTEHLRLPEPERLALFNWKITGHYRYFGPPSPQ